MARNRIIYNVLAVYASQVAATGAQTGVNTISQLSRVQSFDEDFSRSFQDVNQYGNLAAIDRLEVEAPTVNASLSYYLTNGLNERKLGFSVAPTGSDSLVSCISGLLTKKTDEKNYYLLLASEGVDAAGFAASSSQKSGVIAVGNGFITSYSVNCAVGDFPKATVDIEGLNVRVYADHKAQGDTSPAINSSNGTAFGNTFTLPSASQFTGSSIPTALLPGDILFTPTGFVGYDSNDLKLQDFTLKVDLSRTPLQKIGSRFAFAREINFPVIATLEINAEVGDLVSGDLAALLCDNSLRNFDISLRNQACGGGGTRALLYQFKGAKLVSQNFSSAIGNNATMSASFEVPIGSAQQTDRGIFISGSYAPSDYTDLSS